MSTDFYLEQKSENATFIEQNRTNLLFQTQVNIH